MAADSIDSSRFRIREGHKVDLSKCPTRVKPVYRSKSHYEELLAKHIHDLGELQEILYADDTYSLLLIFQAMDAAGKDGTIQHVMSGINPQGCQVFSFKHPSATELDHDFLWRTTQSLPERGRIGIFNRSYYEEVLIVRVHPEILAGQKLPPELETAKGIWKSRYKSIVEFEDHMYRSGTRILKFFLHVSKEEQRKRFLKRIDDPSKQWKFAAGDLKERAFWDQYMAAYEDCLAATSTKQAPWYAVPADDKKTARLIVSQAVVEALRGLKMKYPALSDEQRKEMMALRDQLQKEE
jgi:PPK2 family polyphosphate:nucleotide phosphotransferase